MAIHNCDQCNLAHDASAPQEDPQVAIARINAESALKIAQLAARAEKHVAEVEAEADVEVIELQADAIVESAVVVAEAEAEAAAEASAEAEGAQPVVVVQDNTDEAPAMEEPPDFEDEGHSGPARKKGLGLWGGA
jgi:hypothetical protein